jgi:uncharacterized repeat protein (TIGR03806 family)
MKMKWGWMVLLPVFLVGIVIFNRCTTATAVNVQPSADPFKKLSDYRFFVGNLADLQPNEGVLPYDLNSSLFTDYAHKARFVWMPEGVAAAYSAEQMLDYPVGAVLIKNFYYENDERDASLGRRIVETRLLVKRSDEKWDANTYVWNNTQTDAFLEIAGENIPVAFTNTKGEKLKFTYSVPNKTQCKSCHNEGNTIMPIGPKVRNLNKNFSYEDGAMNQLDKWASMGYLTGYDSKAEHLKVAVWDDPTSGSLDARAKAYLEINCGHCHSENGPANTSGLYLSTLNFDANRWGICKTPVAAGRGAGNAKVDIMPGHPEESILHYRMDSDDPGIMMPEIGRKLVHTEGVALIKEWITAMDENRCGF